MALRLCLIGKCLSFVPLSNKIGRGAIRVARSDISSSRGRVGIKLQMQCRIGINASRYLFRYPLTTASLNRGSMAAAHKDSCPPPEIPIKPMRSGLICGTCTGNRGFASNHGYESRRVWYQRRLPALPRHDSHSSRSVRAATLGHVALRTPAARQPARDNPGVRPVVHSPFNSRGLQVAGGLSCPWPVDPWPLCRGLV